MSAQHFWRRTGFTFCLLGAALCALMLQVHAVGTAGFPAFVCGNEGGACESVANSAWATIPPRSASDGSAGIPIAAIGLFYFTVMAIGFTSLAGAFPRRFFFALNGVGAVVSLVLIAALAFSLHAWCLLCLGAHAINLAIIALRFRPTLDLPFPSRPIAATVVVALLLAEWSGYQAFALSVENRDLRKLRDDVDAIEVPFFTAKPSPIRIRADDPQLAAEPGGPFLTLVMFGDAECLSCAMFERLLDEEIKPLFDGHLRVVYKHFPLEVHPNAMDAAKALEAARLQGKFWDMHDALRGHRDRLAQVDYAAIAVDLGMDRVAFDRDMNSAEVRNRIDEDRAQGGELRIQNTPRIFLNGQLVEHPARESLAFWKRRAETFLKDSGQSDGKTLLTQNRHVAGGEGHD